MFDILSVNAYGSQTLMKLKKDGSELNLGGLLHAHVYMCCLRILAHVLCIHTLAFLSLFTLAEGHHNFIHTTC